MKKAIIIMLAVVALISMTVSSGHAYIYGADYPNGDSSVIFSSLSWDGFNHFVVTFNSEDLTAVATVLTPSGTPTDSYGYYYFWADFFPAYMDLYGSNDGVNWYFYQRWYY
ncbi:MAG: hypothetical protein AB1390_00345 [Nitrospirota bacterium]